MYMRIFLVLLLLFILTGCDQLTPRKKKKVKANYSATQKKDKATKKTAKKKSKKSSRKKSSAKKSSSTYSKPPATKTVNSSTKGTTVDRVMNYGTGKTHVNIKNKAAAKIRSLQTRKKGEEKEEKKKAKYKRHKL